MLIENLLNENSINSFFCDECQENGISINIEESINAENIAIIKVDDYYNTTIHDDSRPKSPDCLIIQRCDDTTYNIYIIELKDINSASGFKVSDIEEKFTTCLDDFMSVRFGNYFHDRSINYKSIKLYFISDPYGFKSNPIKQEKMRGHKLDLLIATRIPRYFDKHLYIEPKIPNPTIRNCSIV